MKSPLRRVVHAVLMLLALSAGWTASASALPGVPPPPPITLPTVSVPTVTVPPVTTRVVKTPAVTTPAVRAPAVPVQAPRIAVPHAQPPQPQPHGDSGHWGVGQSTGEVGQGGAETSREQASRLRLARERTSRRMPRSQRRTMLVIALPRAGLVELAVQQVAPDCRLVGQYRVRGHRGVNRLRLRAQVGRHRLTPGTYVVVVRSVPEDRIVGRAKLVVPAHTRKGKIRASREAGSCRPGTSLGNVSSPGPPPPPAGARSRTPGSKKPDRPTHHRGVLGAKFGKALLSAADSVPLWVYGLLAFAVGLLGAAATLPKAGARGLSASLLAGSVGAAILLGLTIAFSLG